MKLLHTREVGRAKECVACGGCVGRREFFRVGLGATLAGAVLGALPRSLAALPLDWIDGREDGTTMRYPVPTEDSIRVDRSREVILVRHESMMFAFALSCPHQRSMLRWRAKKGRFQCTKHHSEYSPEGVYIKGRATRNMDRLAIRLEDDQVVVDRTVVYRSDEDPEGWAAAQVVVS